MYLYQLIKYAFIFLFFLKFLITNKEIQNDIIYNFDKFGKYSLSSLTKTIIKFPEIFLTVSDLQFTYSKTFNIIEIVYHINLYDQNFHIIKPSNLPLIYNLGILCNFYSYDTNENIYSIANIHENQNFYCVEYSKISEHSKYGIKIYKIKEIGEEIEYKELFFFSDKIINFDQSPSIENNVKFNINNMQKNHKQLLMKITNFKQDIFNKESNNLLLSFIHPPLSFLKKDIALMEGKWYFNNIYENYFCFCKGESCVNINILYNKEFQTCKYYFYLTIIENNKYIYSKTDYLLSDFFDENIESSDAFPIFQEMIKRKFKAHYIIMSWSLYNKLCSKNSKCRNDLEMIYGIRRIDGDVIEKYLELFLKLKVVIAAEKYDGIDNIFYNIDYITYIFLGHGVQYIKSYLYNDYLSPKNYNKIVLPPSHKFTSLAIQAGWKDEDILKITCPKFDKYEIYKKKTVSFYNNEKNERAIFLMFTWRKVKRGKNVSILYYDNISNLLNNTLLNEKLYINNIKLYFCYHHTLKEKKDFNIQNDNVRFISQHEISTLLINSSLIITDFSAILFDAIVQKKPLILFIPDGLDPNLQEIYSNEYYETIIKIKNGIINLNEVFLDLNETVNKIIYYIQNDFDLEKEKLKFYEQFKLKNRGNTRKLINFVKNIK